MDDPSKEFLSVLNAALHAYPEQRVAQIIVNALGEDPFHMTDAEAVALLKNYIKYGRTL